MFVISDTPNWFWAILLIIILVTFHKRDYLMKWLSSFAKRKQSHKEDKQSVIQQGNENTTIIGDNNTINIPSRNIEANASSKAKSKESWNDRLRAAGNNFSRIDAEPRHKDEPK